MSYQEREDTQKAVVNIWLRCALQKMESRFRDELTQYLTDHASTTTTSRYVVSVFLSLLSALGTVGNATVLWVFWARRQQVVATLFIVVLAAVDFSTCLIVMPFTVYMELKHFHVQMDAACKLYQVYYFLFINMFNTKHCRLSLLNPPWDGKMSIRAFGLSNNDGDGGW